MDWRENPHEQGMVLFELLTNPRQLG
jgi:hypothetical protein